LDIGPAFPTEENSKISCIGVTLTDGGPNDRDGRINRKVDLTLLFVKENSLPEIHIAGRTNLIGGEDLVLNASNTLDLDGQALTFQWTQIAGDVDLMLAEASGSELVIETPKVDKDTTIQFELKVSDGKANVTTNIEVVLQPEEAGTLYWLVLISILLVCMRKSRQSY